LTHLKSSESPWRQGFAATNLNLAGSRLTKRNGLVRGALLKATWRTAMQTSTSNKNPCNDRWLAALVDAMDDVEALAADDFCRSADVPAGLLAQLNRRAPEPARATLQRA
jgi:hypothetical protein